MRTNLHEIKATRPLLVTSLAIACDRAGNGDLEGSLRMTGAIRLAYGSRKVGGK